MFRFILISCTIIFANLSLYAQTYYTGWDNTAELNGWTQIKKGDNGTYEWDFDNSTFKSPDSCLAHYYPVGGSIPTDNWFVSPVFDFFGGGQIDTLWKNYNGFGTPMMGDSLALYLLSGSSEPDLATKTIIYNFADSTYSADNVWRKDSLITIPATTGDSYLAFRYYTTNNWLDVKFDNLYVTYTPSSSGLNDLSVANEMMIYPNPANELLNFSIKSNEKVNSISVMDISGKEVLKVDNSSTSFNVSMLKEGSYFLQIRTTEKVYTKKFMKVK